MLLLGRQTARTCQHVDRRSFMQIGGSSVLGLSLADWLRAKDAPSGRTPGSAKAVILVWLWGGPSQLDTFDPKPNAPLQYRGPFAPIATRIPGVNFTEHFPKLADQTKQLTIIRSLKCESNDHGIAGTIGLTGSGAGGVDLGGKVIPGAARPATGAVVAKAISGQNRTGRDTGLHPFLVIGGKLHQGHKPIIGEGGGPLGAMYDPFRLQYDPVHGTKVPALQLPAELTPERLSDRQTLMSALASAENASQQQGHALDAYRQRAFALLTSPTARQMFDLSSEKPSVIDRYGRYRFGQSCLLARRLVENGVPFVQVNWSDHVEAEEDAGDGGWDHHYRNFQIMQDRHAPWLDQSLSALIDDLQARGLLSTTLVLAVGEFGREPKINNKSGREHWPSCYSALIAGGGVCGGRVIGSSDAKAAHPVDNPIAPGDLAATIHHAVGLTSEQITGLGLLPAGRVIEELF